MIEFFMTYQYKKFLFRIIFQFQKSISNAPFDTILCSKNWSIMSVNIDGLEFDFESMLFKLIFLEIFQIQNGLRKWISIRNVILINLRAKLAGQK